MFRPLKDRVLARRIEAPEKTAGGLFIPKTAEEKPLEVRIVAVGNGHVLDDGTVLPLEVKPGNVVLIASFSGIEVKIDGEEHLILREDEILGVLA